MLQSIVSIVLPKEVLLSMSQLLSKKVRKQVTITPRKVLVNRDSHLCTYSVYLTIYLYLQISTINLPDKKKSQDTSYPLSHFPKKILNIGHILQKLAGRDCYPFQQTYDTLYTVS